MNLGDMIEAIIQSLLQTVGEILNSFLNIWGIFVAYFGHAILKEAMGMGLDLFSVPRPERLETYTWVILFLLIWAGTAFRRYRKMQSTQPRTVAKQKRQPRRDPFEQELEEPPRSRQKYFRMDKKYYVLGAEDGELIELEEGDPRLDEARLSTRNSAN